MSLPIFLLKVNDDDESTGWEYTALVDKPATQETWMAFNEEKKLRYEFKTVDEEKRIVMGALMVANLPILRKDDKGSEYLVVFDAFNIDKALQKFSRQGNQKKVNMMHNPNQKVDGVYMYQCFIINSELGINTPKGFNELTDGSAFGVFKVDNDLVWNDIKAGKFQGFSIEGNFIQEPMTNLTDEEIGLLEEALNNVPLK